MSNEKHIGKVIQITGPVLISVSGKASFRI